MFSSNLKQFLKAGGRVTDEVKITVAAPAEHFEQALKQARLFWVRCHPNKKRSVIRPDKSFPWLIHYDGVEIHVEWIPKGKIDWVNHGLTKSGFMEDK